MDKYTETISLRVTALMKKEYEELNEEQRKTVKRIMLEDLAKYCWGKLHYNPKFYFDGDDE